MKTLTYAAIVLAAIASAAPAMAQVLSPASPYNAYGQPNQVYGIPGAGQVVSGAAPATAQVSPPDAPYNAYGQPNQIDGMPGAGQASASSHPAQ